MYQARSIIILLLFLVACKEEVVHHQHSSKKEDIKAKHLLSASEAYQLILLDSTRSYIPIQVSKKSVYESEHLPNALNLWRPDYGAHSTLPYGGLVPQPEKLELLLRSLGFKNGKTLLLYDAKANVDALRFAWVLSLYGFKDYKVINGGLKSWKLNSLPIVSGKKPKIEKSDFELKPHFDHSMIANFEEVRAAIGDRHTILVDTREDYEFRGEPFIKGDEVFAYKKGAFNRGSIPSALHLNWSTLADLNGDHRIKSMKDLKFDLEHKGISDDKEIILYCQSGSRTSHTYYVLKHVLGYNKVKNYDGSWIEWSYKHSKDPTVPITQLCKQDKFNFMLDSMKNLSLSKSKQ